MGGQRERWEQQQRYKSYQNAKKRGKKSWKSNRHAQHASTMQWAAIANQVKDAGKKVWREDKLNRKRERRSNERSRRFED